jgi:hypothetical protein
MPVNNKEYQKKYYAEHKKEIIAKMCQKEQCPYCNRTVNHTQMFKHQQSKYCRDRYELKQKREKVETSIENNINTI